MIGQRGERCYLIYLSQSFRKTPPLVGFLHYLTPLPAHSTLVILIILNKYVKYTLKGIVILLSVLVILYAFVFIYVSANKKKIIKQVTDEIGKKLSGDVTIGDVELSFFSRPVSGADSRPYSRP